MKEPERQDIEKYLGSVRFRPVPQELRARILGAAVAGEKARRALTPFLRWCFAGCAAALIVIFAADTLVSRHERGRIDAFWGDRPPIHAEEDSEFSALAEIISMPSAYLQAALKRTPPSDPAAVRKAIATHLFNPDKISISEEEF